MNQVAMDGWMDAGDGKYYPLPGTVIGYRDVSKVNL